MQRIAIIGGGAAGAAVAGEFLRRGPDENLALTWLVGRHAPGRGVAYATANDQHLLNVRAANMGLFADDAGALLRFAHARGLHSAAADFLPRSVFGDYAEDALAQLLSTHAVARPIDVRSTEAVALRPRVDGGYLVSIEEGAALAVDQVILAIGAPPPCALPQVEPSAMASGRYAVDAWSLPRLTEAPQRIVVIGTGLTAIDAILGAADTWPDAQIVVVSRRGRIPARHRHEPSQPYAHQHDLLAELRAQPRIQRWVRVVREAFDEAADWRSVVDGLRPATTELWKALDGVQRGRFLRHVRCFWETVRHRMAPQAAEAIEQLRDAGRLDVYACRVERIAGAGCSPLTLTLRHRGDTMTQTLAADLVIQATGFEMLTEQTRHRLLQQLVADGLVRVDPFGLGLECDAAGRPVREDGTRTPGLHIVGALLRGALWECTALPEIRASAAKLVQELRKQCAREAAPNLLRLRDYTAWNIDMADRQLGT